MFFGLKTGPTTANISFADLTLVSIAVFIETDMQIGFTLIDDSFW